MTEKEFCAIKGELANYAHSSMRYSAFSQMEGFEVILSTPDLILTYGFNGEAKLHEYHWAANSAKDIIQAIVSPTCLITFVPNGWIKDFESAGFCVRSAWQDYFMTSLDSVQNEHEGARFLKDEESEIASRVTLSCRGQSRGFTGQTDQWIKAWLNQEDDGTHNNAIIVSLNETNEIIGLVCTATYKTDTGVTAWIREVAVKPQYQNRGVARRLITQALSYGKARGASQAFLAADELNFGAIHLYKSIGFVPSKEEGQIDMIKE